LFLFNGRGEGAERYFGEMSELAEGARLEIACTAKRRYRGFESLSLRHILLREMWRDLSTIAEDQPIRLIMYYVYFLLNEARIEFVISGSGSEEKI
jgi:hypothetical protein